MKKAKYFFTVLCMLFTSLVFASCEDKGTITKVVRSDDLERTVRTIVIIAVSVLVVALIAVLVIRKIKKLSQKEEFDNAVDTDVKQDMSVIQEYNFEEDRRWKRTEAESAPAESEKEASEETGESVEAEITEEPAATEIADSEPEKAPETEEVKEEAVTEKDIVTDKAEDTAAEEAEDTAEPKKHVIDGCEYTLDENGMPIVPDGMLIRYKWSFLARLICSDSVIKSQYMTLRRYLLSYQKVRSNVSWNFDSYFIGRKPIVKLKVRGKTLVAYFPIDPKEMEGTKYAGEDVSNVSRYKAVPFAYRISGTRKLKYAMELIAKLLEGVKSTEPDYIDASQVEGAIPREGFKSLFGRGYIRIGGIIPIEGGRAKADADDDDDEDITAVEDDVADTTVYTVPREEFNFNPEK